MVDWGRGLCLGMLVGASAIAALAEERAAVGIAGLTGPTLVSEPVVPSVTAAAKDLADPRPESNSFGLEMKRREDFGFIPVTYTIKPQIDPLFDSGQLRSSMLDVGFASPVYNFPGQTSSASPPDANGDVGPQHYVQAVNQSGSKVRVMSKTTGADLKTFTMQSLTTATPCSTGYCDSVVLYDRAADRWFISELPRTTGNVCIYVSTSPDPMGTWYAYSFPVETSLADFPKYGVWPQGSHGGSYLMGANAGAAGVRDVFAFDRAKMLAGQPATFQKFSVPKLPNSGFQLVLPSTMQGNTLPPDGEPAVFIRPRDDEAQNGATTPGGDFLDMWQLSVDWATPANSALIQLAPSLIADYDMTLCGMGNVWNCMPQPGTWQKLDPIREPLHFPLQYRNFGTHQSLVGTFPVDADGADHAALRWFELRKTGVEAWSVFQQGLIGGEAGVHRSVGSIAMDRSGNIAVAYTRTGTTAPYFPSIYYRGRLASDTPGTLPQGEYPVIDAATSKVGNERWGDYASMAVDPADDCTFWFTSLYGGAGTTRVSAFKFDACGCLEIPAAPAVAATTPQGNRIAVSWHDSSTASVAQYRVFRSTTAGGPYALIAEVADSNPGVGGGPTYSYDDDAVSGGTRYYYQVKATDGVSCLSNASNEADAVATGQCLLAPSFAGPVTVINPGNSTCTLTVHWNPAVSNCGSGVSYNVYRSLSAGFTPSAENRIAAGVRSQDYFDSFEVGCGTSYHYAVRAVDDANGSEETNVAQRSGVSTGPLTMTSWSETFEGGLTGGEFDLLGWARWALSGPINWIWSSGQAHDGTHSWVAADLPYVSDKVLVSPPFGVGPSTTLSFWHTYRFEGSLAACYDAGTLEYTTNAGTTWSVVPATSFVVGGYTGTANPMFSNPIGGKPAWCAGTIGPMTQVVVNLGASSDLVGKTVQMRWHEGDDSGVGSTGWYVDSVTVSSAQTGDTCTIGTGVLTVSSQPVICEGATLELSAIYTQVGVSFGWTGPNGFSSSLQNPSILAVGPAVSGTYFVTLTSGSATLASGSTVVAVIPDGSSCASGNPCTSAMTCVSGECLGGTPVPAPHGPEVLEFDGSNLVWAPSAGALAYDVIRGTLSGLRSAGLGAATTTCESNDRTLPSFTLSSGPVPDDGEWFLVRAVGTCGTASYDDGSPSPLPSRDAALSTAAHACP